MKVYELIAHLESADPEAEVRIATQPTYPLRHTITNVVAEGDLERDEEDEGDKVPDILWIATDAVSYDENPYASRRVWG